MRQASVRRQPQAPGTLDDAADAVRPRAPGQHDRLEAPSGVAEEPGVRPKPHGTLPILEDREGTPRDRVRPGLAGRQAGHRCRPKGALPEPLVGDPDPAVPVFEQPPADPVGRQAVGRGQMTDAEAVVAEQALRRRQPQPPVRPLQQTPHMRRVEPRPGVQRCQRSIGVSAHAGFGADP